MSELFRMCKSKLAIHTIQQQDNSTTTQNGSTTTTTSPYDSGPQMSDEDLVRGIAREYKLGDASFAELCDNNCYVAKKMNKEHVALTWVGFFLKFQ